MNIGAVLHVTMRRSKVDQSLGLHDAIPTTAKLM